MRIKQSVCYPIFGDLPMSLDELFRQTKSIGYDAIELWGRGNDFEAMMDLAARHKLAVASMGGHHHLHDGLNKRANHDRIESELKTSIDLAAKHHVHGLICFSGNHNEGQSEADAIEATAAGLGRIVPYAQEKGVTLNLELLNSKIDHPGYQCDHTRWGVAVCQRVNSPRVKLLYDIYHMQIMEGDIIRTIRENARWIGHFHTAGNPGRQDMDDTQELNYTGICRAIAATDYAGFVGHEFKPKGDLTDAIRQAFASCNVG